MHVWHEGKAYLVEGIYWLVKNNSLVRNYDIGDSLVPHEDCRIMNTEPTDWWDASK